MLKVKTQSERLGAVLIVGWTGIAAMIARSETQRMAEEVRDQTLTSCLKYIRSATLEHCDLYASGKHDQALGNFWPLLAGYALVPILIGLALVVLRRWIRSGENPAAASPE